MAGTRIRVWQDGDGGIKREFDNFVGDACSVTEDAIQIFQARTGVKINVTHTDIKRRTEKQKITEREKEKN